MDIRPDYANLKAGGQVRRVDPAAVAVGDVIVVKPFEKVPLDGIVVSGSSALNTSALTGESLPRDVSELSLIHIFRMWDGAYGGGRHCALRAAVRDAECRFPPVSYTHLDVYKRQP